MIHDHPPATNGEHTECDIRRTYPHSSIQRDNIKQSAALSTPSVPNSLRIVQPPENSPRHSSAETKSATEKNDNCCCRDPTHESLRYLRAILKTTIPNLHNEIVYFAGADEVVHHFPWVHDSDPLIDRPRRTDSYVRKGSFFFCIISA